MGWPGWDNYLPRPGAAAANRGTRLGARPVVLTPDGHVVAASTAKAAGTMGTWFASKKEAARWRELTWLAETGAIRQLRRQVRFPLHAPGRDGGVLVGHYVADFVYERDGLEVVEDVKGPARREDLYLWKKRHLHAEHGIQIQEV